MSICRYPAVPTLCSSATRALIKNPSCAIFQLPLKSSVSSVKCWVRSLTGRWKITAQPHSNFVTGYDINQTPLQAVAVAFPTQHGDTFHQLICGLVKKPVTFWILFLLILPLSTYSIFQEQLGKLCQCANRLFKHLYKACPRNVWECGRPPFSVQTLGSHLPLLFF